MTDLACHHSFSAMIRMEVEEFYRAREQYPVVGRCLDMAAITNIPVFYAWLMAANSLLKENARLRDRLAAAEHLKVCDQTAAPPAWSPERRPPGEPHEESENQPRAAFP